MKPEEMVALYEYNAWADRRALQAASALTREQFTKQLGSSFSSVRDTLSHIYGVEWLWLERFQCREPRETTGGAAAGGGRVGVGVAMGHVLDGSGPTAPREASPS